MTAPRGGPCTPWVSSTVLRTLDSLSEASEEILGLAAEASSDALYRLSGSQFTGDSCGPVTVRPISRPVDSDDRSWGLGLSPLGYFESWGSCSVTGFGYTGALDHYGCSNPPEVDLGAFPVTAITEVKIDGTVIPSTEYALQDYRTLVRIRPTAATVPTDRWGWPTCFPEGVLVTTERGQIPIESVQVGDRVLTHRNRWQRVTWAGQTGVRETVRLRGQGGVLRCTADHRIYSSPLYDTRSAGFGPPEKPRFKLGAPEWVRADATIGSTWATPAFVAALPIPQLPSDVPDAFWWIAGRWLGDGWTDAPRKNGNRTRVVICSGKHEADELEAVLTGTGWNWRRCDKGRGVKFRLSDHALSEWLTAQFGSGAHAKQIPSWLLGASEDIRSAFLAGYVSADGWSATPDDRAPFTSVHTVSRRLAVGLRILVGTLGYPASLYESAAANGSGYNVRQPYRIDWPSTKPGEHRSHAWRDDDHIWTRVREAVLDELAVPVFDIEVEDDHSFVADGTVVHNCQQYDLPDSELNTFSVSYTYGQPPPVLGVLAAKKLAENLALSWIGADNDLPVRTTSIQREGVSAVVTDVMDFLAKGQTGIYECDLFIKMTNPHGQRRQSAVWSPDLGRARRVAY